MITLELAHIMIVNVKFVAKSSLKENNMNWFKKLFHKLFHKHDIVWTNRKLIENTNVTSNAGVMVDVEPARVYLYEGYCLKCGQKGFVSKVTILNIFDQEQPYDEKY